MKSQKTTQISQRRLASYSAMAVAIAGGSQVNAQIVYTNIDPDIHYNTLGGEVIHGGECFDFNDDAQTDLCIGLNFRSVTDTDYQTFSMGVFSYGEVNGDYFVSALPEGSLINATNNDWLGPYRTMFQLVQYSGFSYGSGDWLNAEDKYLGFRIPVDGNYLYGWLRITCLIDYPGVPFVLTDLSIKDFAYNATPGAPILAGEGMPGCEVPEPIGTFAIGPFSAKLKWEDVEDADSYQIFYRQIGAGSWQKKNAATNQKTINSLICDTDYEWKVRAKCGATTTAFSDVQTFSTVSCKMSDEIASGEFEIVALYPNPSSDFLILETDLSGGGINMEISDITGRVLILNNLEMEDGQIKIDVTGFPSGIYSIKIINGNIARSIKFIRQ